MILPIELCNCTSDHKIEVSTSQQPHPSVISYHVSPPYLLIILTFDIIESLWLLLNHIHGIPCSSLVVQSCLTLWNLINVSLSGSCVHGIFQARILKWVAIFYSRTWNHTGCPCLITAIWYFAVPPTFCICVKFVNFHSSLCEFNS